MSSDEQTVAVVVLVVVVAAGPTSVRSQGLQSLGTLSARQSVTC